MYIGAYFASDRQISARPGLEEGALYRYSADVKLCSSRTGPCGDGGDSGGQAMGDSEGEETGPERERERPWLIHKDGVVRVCGLARNYWVRGAGC